MQVETHSINGFEIDVFNQYGLKEGAKKGICPLCSHNRKPANQKKEVALYDWQRGIGTCNHCSGKFQLHTFKKKHEDKEYVKPVDLKVEGIQSEKLLKWFNDRGISQQTLNELKVTDGKEWMPQTKQDENVILFNYYEDGELTNIKYRDGRKNFKLHKGSKKIFYNIDSIVDYEYCIIVEGEMDVLSLHEAGITNAISVPNGATLNRNNLDYLDNCIDYFADKERVLLAVDNDEAGEALRQEFIRRLGSEVCYLVDFQDCKDANEYLLKYGTEELSKCITGAKPVPLENVVTFKDIESEVVDFIKEGFKPGYQTGLHNFDDIFSTYTGQFITVTGIPSSGKSDFVDQMVVGYNEQYGWKTAFASPENVPTFLHAHKLMRKQWRKMPHASDVGTEEWNNVKEHISNSYFHIDMERYSLDAVLSKAAELVKRKGIKCLVIDPFNKVRDLKGVEDVNKYTMEYLQKIEIFCKKYDVLTMIVAHPTKMYKGQDGKTEEPTMYNIKGGGEWYDASYHGLLVHRDYERNLVKVKVLKVKFQNLGENQAECWFRWDKTTGRFIPYEEPDVSKEKAPWE